MRSIRRLATGGLLLAALALPTTPAFAATHILRPVTSPVVEWTVSPGGDLASVLDDAVVAPEAPSTAGDYAAINAKGAFNAAVGFAAPTLAAGETPLTVRLRFYAQSGAATALSGSVWANDLLLVYVTLPAGSPAGWYETAAVPVTAEQLAILYGNLHVDATTGFTPSVGYAMYAEVATTDAPAEQPPAETAPLPEPEAPADEPKHEGRQADPAPQKEPAPDAEQPGQGKKDEAKPVATTAFTPTLPDPAIPLLYTPAAGAVPVEIGCPATSQGPCRGTIVLRLTAPVTHTRRARAARCARVCRVIGEGKFKIAAGGHQKVRVKVKKSARKALRGRKTLRASMTITNVGPNGRKSVSTRRVSIRVG